MTRARWFRLAAHIALFLAVVAAISREPTRVLILLVAWLVCLVGEDVARGRG